jgi:hypothetical protein
MGMTMPKPTRSMKTIRKTMPIFARCSFKNHSCELDDGAFYTAAKPPAEKPQMTQMTTVFVAGRRQRQ